MFLKKYLLWILLFGTLIGLNESLIGSFNTPYRSVVLSAISLLLLSIARIKMQKAGTSILIILIAVLFKVNNMGFHNCTSHALLCGPTAILMLGITYEVFAGIFAAKNKISYLQLLLICSLSSIATFSLFAVMNTFILRAWDMDRLYEYILVKSTLSAFFSGSLGLLAVYLSGNIPFKGFSMNAKVINGILSTLILMLWLCGSLVKF